MNICPVTEIDGHLYILDKLPNEGVEQLAARRRFIFSQPIIDHADIASRIELSKYYHNVRFKGCTYSAAIMAKLAAAAVLR